MNRKPTLQEAALAVVRRLREHGHEALWAGGCVRDMLLGREPEDIDVATNAPPDRIVAIFRQTRRVGMQFGVVLVKERPHWIEVATFRQDVNYTDGRRPERVIFTTAEEDAKRRDFTINGLFFDPIENRVIDYVGGRADLDAKVVRAIGAPADRFAEDHLRMLRAARFAARLGFHVDQRTAEAIREHAASLTRISPERIREELERMLTHPSRSQALELISNLNLMSYLWSGAEGSPESIHHSSKVLARLSEPVNFALGMAALLHDRSPRQVETVGRALRCSNREIEETTWLVSNQDRLSNPQLLSLSAFKRLAAFPCFPELLELSRSVCEAYERSSEGLEAARRRWQEIPADQIAPSPFVTGEDLIRLGLLPGPEFKVVLETLYTAQLENELRTPAEAETRLRELLAARTHAAPRRETDP